MVYTLVNRCFKSCSNRTFFHTELQQLKHIFRKNEYPENFKHSCLKKFNVVKQNVSTVEKKNLILVFSFLGTVLLQT